MLIAGNVALAASIFSFPTSFPSFGGGQDRWFCWQICQQSGQEMPLWEEKISYSVPSNTQLVLRDWSGQVGQGSRTDEAAAAFISAKMAKALSNRWRAQILSALRSRPMSPSEFVDEIGGDLSNISRCFRQLEKWGYVELVETRRGGSRRGGVEHVYRSVQRAQIDTASWENLPPHLKGDFSAAIIDTYIARIAAAAEAGTLGLEPAQHLSWDGPMLDRQAWIELTDKLDEVLAWLPELEAESTNRMATSDEDPIPTTIGLFAFRSPKPSEATPKSG